MLLEGSPGVGKTSLVAALAKASGNHLVRINLSEQTVTSFSLSPEKHDDILKDLTLVMSSLWQDVTDLFGTDLPVEGGKGGEFAWRDGPLLAALKAGHWVVLDEVGTTTQIFLVSNPKKQRNKCTFINVMLKCKLIFFFLFLLCVPYADS